jgi:hypothetical protein
MAELVTDCSIFIRYDGYSYRHVVRTAPAADVQGPRNEHRTNGTVVPARVATTILSHTAYGKPKEIKHPAGFDPLVAGMASYAKSLLVHQEIERCLASSIPSWPRLVLEPHHSQYTISFAVTNSLAQQAMNAYAVEYLLYGCSHADPNPMVAILGVQIPRVQAVQMLRHLLWMRYSLDIIDMLSLATLSGHGSTSHMTAWATRCL